MEEEEEQSMDIGQPTDVRHVTHVTYDRFYGFLGLPSEFEPEVPRKAPSASTSAFGVSPQSMQLSYDSRGNCVPVILLRMQNRLYAQEGLQAEGIFRITADNSEEEYVREQLNRGVIPEGIDVHCLAGLIKAWFRELPSGVLDPLPPDQVMQCETEEDFAKLVRLLPQTEGSLLNWAVNLMADVVHHEHLNKMNSRNVALVFAPNMSSMADPLTALMYAVQVMNLIKTLIEKELRDREAAASRLDHSQEKEHDSPYEWCDDDHDSDEDEDNNGENDKEIKKASGEDEEEEGDAAPTIKKEQHDDPKMRIKEQAINSPVNEASGRESAESVTFSKNNVTDGIRSDSTKNVGKPTNSGFKNVTENAHSKSQSSPNSVSGFPDVAWG